MARLMSLSARAFSSLAIVCAVLSVLAAPNATRADPLVPCDVQCAACQKGPSPSDWDICMGNCQNNIGTTPCRIDPGDLGTTCDDTCSASYPQCGTGKCDPKTACTRYTCKLILIAKQCECNPN